MSAELGGADKDVKAYFFSLSPTALAPILKDYESRYGTSARQYAQSALPQWRNGRRQMSGLVAERLVDLLPPRMPLVEKYKLIEGLWKHVGPTSRKVLRVGVDSAPADILEAAAAHIEEVVVSYQIPERLEHRFQWLAAGDANVRQQLLNHLRAMEKNLVVDAVRLHLPVLLEHSTTNGEITQRVTQTVQVGKHELTILLDRPEAGIHLEEPSVAYARQSRGTGSGGAIIWWIIGGLIALGWFVSQNGN